MLLQKEAGFQNISKSTSISLQSVVKPSNNKAPSSTLSAQEENREGRICRQRKLNDFFF